MLPDLLNIIESDRIAAAFYLLGDTDSLYRWISRLPAVSRLEHSIGSDPISAELLASRALALFYAAVASDSRTESEAALCCYAYALSRSASESARRALDSMDAQADPRHGWLRRLLDKCLADDAAVVL